ncbi:MAG: ferrous iron transport protein A [Bacteroidales bacterium]|nr:ferrous iron transport protein A [Bacteroidales bacterium]
MDLLNWLTDIFEIKEVIKMSKIEKLLSEMEVGEEARVLKVEKDNDSYRRIIDMGLIRGTKLKVIRKAPMGDPIEFFIKGYNLSLRKKDASIIKVEVL